MKRLVCTFCDKRFEADEDRRRHVHHKHRKAAALVHSLTKAIRPFREAGQIYLSDRVLGNDEDDVGLSVWLPGVTVGDLRRLMEAYDG